MISLGAIARLSGSTWGGNFTTLRQLYRGVVIPQMSYACSLWYIPVGEKGIVRVMSKCYRLCRVKLCALSQELLGQHLYRH